MNVNNHLNLRPYKKKPSNSNLKLPIITFDKANNKSDKSGISLISQFDSRKNNINNISDLNRKQENNISQIIYVQNKDKSVKKLFPYRYYLFSEFIKNIDINQYFRCCFSKKYAKVYKFIGKLFDISSYLVLQREFSIIKNYTFKQNELNMIEQDIKINLNDHSFMRDINDCIGGTKSNIFSKNIKENHKKRSIILKNK